MKYILTISCLILFLETYSQSSDLFEVASTTLNIRNGPGKENEVLFVLHEGDIVTVLGKADNGWWLIDYENLEGYAYSQLLKKSIPSAWKKVNYSSGDTPECENIFPKYDYNIDNYLSVNVGDNTDVVVKLMEDKYDNDVCIRIAYIRSGESFSMNNIPEGKYYLKIAYGKDWRQKIIDEKCIGEFKKYAIYEKGIDILDFNIKHLTDRNRIPSYELTLDVVVNKFSRNSFDSNEISAAEFNK